MTALATEIKEPKAAPPGHRYPLDDIDTETVKVGQTVEVRADVSHVKECFRAHNEPFVEVGGTDRFAITTGLAAFAPAWLLGVAGLHLTSLFVFLGIAYYCVYHHRLWMKRLELIAERQFRLRKAIQQEEIETTDKSGNFQGGQGKERLEWLNAAVWKIWEVHQGSLSGIIREQIQGALNEMLVNIWPVAEFNVKAFSIGSLPPRFRYATYEGSNVYGEFKINTEGFLLEPDLEMEAEVVLQCGGLRVTVPLKLADVLVRFDLQLLARVSGLDGAMNILKFMFNQPMELDYRLVLFRAIDLTALPLVQHYLSHIITDSLLFMTKPNMYILHEVPGAVADPELSKPARIFGQLEIEVVAIGLPRQQRDATVFVRAYVLPRGSNANAGSAHLRKEEEETHLKKEELDDKHLRKVARFNWRTETLHDDMKSESHEREATSAHGHPFWPMHHREMRGATDRGFRGLT
jgi:hypothetical protein